MTYPLSRLMSAATATYGVYALTRPRHLGRAVTSNRFAQRRFDPLARGYGVRDLAVSGVALLGRSERAVTAAMVVRVLFDVSDGVLLAAEAQDHKARAKLLGVTLGWASLNTVALAVDRRRR